MKKITETQKTVYDALSEFGTCSMKSLSCYIKRSRKIDITPAACTAAMRAFVQEGMVAFSLDGNGQRIYWVTDKR